MKKLIVIISAIALISSCNQKSEKQFDAKNLTGVWRIDQYDINGTVLEHESIGKPMIEFRGDEYLINTSGVVEKGRFTVEDSTLKFDCTTNPDKPDNEFTITKLDTSEVEYYSLTEKNRMGVKLLRVSK